MQEPDTWYELLGQLIATRQAKQRLATQLHVSVVTITRWITHTSTPRPSTLRAIINAFPKHRDQFLLLFMRDNLPWLDEEPENTPDDDEFPSVDLYRNLLEIYRQTAPTLRSTTIRQVILANVLEHLDKPHVGIACSLLLCLPPREGYPVRSLYLAEGKGTHPWPDDLRQVGCLLGSESLAGAAIMAGRPLLADRQEGPFALLPSRWSQHECSAFVAPIMRGHQVAGCLLVSCTQPGTFLSDQQACIVYYADLFLLAIEPHWWYDRDQLRLKQMPSYEVQKRFFLQLPQQIITRMVRERSGSYIMIRKQIVQEIEEALVQFTPRSQLVKSGEEVVS